MNLTLPPRVVAGDSVALVSPSWFRASAFPHRVIVVGRTSNRSDCSDNSFATTGAPTRAQS